MFPYDIEEQTKKVLEIFISAMIDWPETQASLREDGYPDLDDQDDEIDEIRVLGACDEYVNQLLAFAKSIKVSLSSRIGG